MLLDPSDRMHGPVRLQETNTLDPSLPVAAQIDPLIRVEWQCRIAEREANRGAWL